MNKIIIELRLCVEVEVTGGFLLSESDHGRYGMCTAFHPRKQRQNKSHSTGGMDSDG